MWDAADRRAESSPGNPARCARAVEWRVVRVVRVVVAVVLCLVRAALSATTGRLRAAARLVEAVLIPRRSMYVTERDAHSGCRCERAANWQRFCLMSYWKST